MDSDIEYADIFSSKSITPFNVAFDQRKYKFRAYRLRVPHINFAFSPNDKTSDIYMKIRAEIYKEMYLNPTTTTGIVDDIPPNMYEFIYDIFVADKSGKITSMPNSSALTIEEFIENNKGSFPSKINDFHDIYIVDEKTFQALQKEQHKKQSISSLIAYVQNKLSHYSSCSVTGKSH